MDGDLEGEELVGLEGTAIVIVEGMEDLEADVELEG